MLQGLIDELAGSGIDLRFSRVKTPVMEVMRRTSLAGAIGEDHFYLRESGGVDAYLAEQGLNQPVAVLLVLAMLVFAFGLVARRLERTIIKEATSGAVEKMGIISETDIFIALRREATII